MSIVWLSLFFPADFLLKLPWRYPLLHQKIYTYPVLSHTNSHHSHLPPVEKVHPFKYQIFNDISCPQFVCLYVIIFLDQIRKHIVQCLEDFLFPSAAVIVAADGDDDAYRVNSKESLLLSHFPPSFCLETPSPLLHDIWYIGYYIDSTVSPPHFRCPPK